MIDVRTEELISLAKAARSLPERRGGKRPSVSCIYRWTARGCKGVILESIQIGGTRCTSREALARFFDRLTCADEPQQAPTRSVAQRQRANSAAEDELRRMGV